MKYEIELRRSFSQWGRTTVEAVNEAHAKAIACGLQVNDIATWKTPDELLDIVSVCACDESGTSLGEECDEISPYRLPACVREALRAVLDYVYDDYAEDYQTLTKSEQCGHIFESILTLNRWLSSPERWR